MGRQPHLGMALEIGQDPGRVTHGHIQTRPEGNRELPERPAKARVWLGKLVWVCVLVCAHAALGGRGDGVLANTFGNLHPCPSPRCACTNAANYL